jgi:hypothetical protein
MSEVAQINAAGQANKTAQMSGAAQKLQQRPAGYGKNLVLGCHPGSPGFAGATILAFFFSSSRKGVLESEQRRTYFMSYFLSYSQRQFPSYLFSVISSRFYRIFQVAARFFAAPSQQFCLE